MSDIEKPLVTFALFAYNQEQYIREAVEGAFAQTYEPLEIILSDDCSADRTFNIMQELADSYKGSRRIIINRNEHNLGIGSHINAVMKMAGGELIVVAAGDDISTANRVEILVEAWLAADKKSELLCSDYLSIDANGNLLGEGKGCKPENMNPQSMAVFGHGVLGATAAWSMNIWRSFNILPGNSVHEDQIMPFRAALLGGVGYVRQPLIRYRQEVSTWVARGATLDPAEMQSRTLKLHRNGMITANTQIADAILAERLEFLAPINKRFMTHQIVTMVYEKQLNLFAAIYQAIRSGANVKAVLKAIIQVKVPCVHAKLLKLKVGAALRVKS